MALVNSGGQIDRQHSRLADRGRSDVAASTPSGLPHGVHGIHVTRSGAAIRRFRRRRPALEPGGRSSMGSTTRAGTHAGDLPNVSVAANGVLGEAVTITGASQHGATDGLCSTADGAAHRDPRRAPTIM